MLYTKLLSDEEVLLSRKLKVKHPGHTFRSFLLALALTTAAFSGITGFQFIQKQLQQHTLIEMQLTADAIIDKSGARSLNKQLYILMRTDEETAAAQKPIPTTKAIPKTTLPTETKPKPETTPEINPTLETTTVPLSETVQEPEKFTVTVSEYPIANQQDYKINTITLADIQEGPIPTEGIAINSQADGVLDIAIVCKFTLRSEGYATDIEIPARATHPQLAQKLEEALSHLRAKKLNQDIRFTFVQRFICFY